MLELKIELNPTERVKINRKLSNLKKRKRIEQRTCKRDVAWWHEYEFKYKK